MKKLKFLTLIFSFVKGLVQKEIDSVEASKEKILAASVKKTELLDKAYDAVLALQIKNTIETTRKTQEQQDYKDQLEQLIS